MCNGRLKLDTKGFNLGQCVVSYWTEEHPRAIAANRRVELRGHTAQRIRLEVADGGILFLDCSLEPTGTDEMALSISGVMDATQLKGHVSSIVRCCFEAEG